ncbi:MAG: 30S ribosomal protein S4 [Candidatus Vogelbacteria bacterium CG22_combo_CG10-13_8_21_14_all_37_9]|uniref:Small ribosomal subunit protein uS4 n=1 Tax=Candidatus Vogelbacteria bacterium CG22_combo_CG10-13_8_21_14_all_37_9 TaxID=1975046 RepID=A0A2H0BKV8_9BACT|nr:MAG: 30S ribosomal protein S4 [bacterium CG10_37_50]PIP58234.1 MAG: 30S ribosomal protein S4 [Candidatus Vogelbacteria bacterium CG22_combo_CG10-13_8_21_14_all_37_9]
MKIGPRYKICRRLGDRVFGKCQTTKFTVSGTAKKVISKRGRRGQSEYGQQLLEKQKARMTYALTERTFSNYVKKARATKGGDPNTELYKLLESRLDNTVYRLGLAATRLAARQTVSHGHILVNGKKVTIPSYQIRKDEVIQIRPGSRDNGKFKELEERLKTATIPEWLVYDLVKNEGQVKGLPGLGSSELTLNFGAILEYYSRV